MSRKRNIQCLSLIRSVPIVAILMLFGLDVIRVNLQKFEHQADGLHHENHIHLTNHEDRALALPPTTEKVNLMPQECPKKFFPSSQIMTQGITSSSRSQEQPIQQSSTLFDYYVNEYNFFNRGGIIIYFHVAKTGGTTIRRFFQKMIYHQEVNNRNQKRNVNFINFQRIHTLDELKSYLPSMKEQYLQQQDHQQLSPLNYIYGNQSADESKRQIHTNRRVLVLELHGAFGDPVPGIIEFETIIQDLRNYNDNTNGVTHGKPLIFSFTVLRSPLDFHISFFHSFKRPSCTEFYCHFPTVKEMNEKSLLQTALWNHQCFYLYQHYDISIENHNKDNTASLQSIVEKNTKALEACQLTHQYMYQYMDYIGTTEQISKETLPLLLSMINPSIKQSLDKESGSIITSQYSLPSARESVETFLGRSNHMSDKSTSSASFVNPSRDRQFNLDDVSSNGIRYLAEISSYDQFMYDCAMKNYLLSSTLQ